MCQCALRIRSVCHNKVAHCFGLQAEVIFGLQRHRGLGGGEGFKNISTRRTKVKVLSRKSQAGRGRRRGRQKADGSCLVISSCRQNGKSTPAAATRREQKRVAKHINNSVTHCGRQWGWHKGQQGQRGWGVVGVAKLNRRRSCCCIWFCNFCLPVGLLTLHSKGRGRERVGGLQCCKVVRWQGGKVSTARAACLEWLIKPAQICMTH